MTTTPESTHTPEQEARDILERMDIPNAQNFSAGDVGEIAQAIAESWELRQLKAATTPWELLNYAQKQQREAAMQRIAGGVGHGAHVTTDFPWQGRVTVAGSWTIAELRQLLAAMEGR